MDGGTRGIPNPPKVHWTAVVKIIKNKYKLDWKQAIKKWKELGKPNPIIDVKKNDDRKVDKHGIVHNFKKKDEKQIKIENLINEIGSFERYIENTIESKKEFDEELSNFDINMINKWKQKINEKKKELYDIDPTIKIKIKRFN